MNEDKKVGPENNETVKDESMDYSFDFSSQVDDSNENAGSGSTSETEASDVKEETPVAPAAPEETPAAPETSAGESTENSSADSIEEAPTKSGKSTIIFGVILLILVAAFIIALPFIAKL